MDSERGRLRVQAASWLSVVGALALVLGGLLFLLDGELSVWVFACTVIGVTGLGLGVWGAPDEFRAWITGRQTRFGTTSILATVLFLGFVVAVYVLVDRADITVDLTAPQRYTLNQPTLDAIARLENTGLRVRLVGFFSRYTLREQESADLLLRQYRAAGGEVLSVEYIDPNAQPDVARRFGYQPGYDGHMFMEVLGPDGSPNPDAMPLYLGPPNERNITTGLLTVASAGSFKVYFTTGHAELDLSRTDDVGISRLRVSLTDQGIAVEPLRLMDVADSGIQIGRASCRERV